MKTYVASPKAASPKSAAVAATCLSLPQVGRICGPNFRHTRLLFSPHSLINQPTVSSWGAPSNPAAMKSVRNAKRLRARGMSRAFAVRGSGIPSSTQRQREQLCNSMEI